MDKALPRIVCFMLMICSLASFSLAGLLEPEDKQAYHSYLLSALHKQDHRNFEASLEKVKKIMLQKLQSQFQGADPAELGSAHQKTWMSLLIEPISHEHNLLIELLKNHKIKNRAEKFSLLVANGLFNIDSESDLSWTFNNLNYSLFAEFLIHKTKQDDEDILAFMMSFLTHEQNESWSGDLSPYQRFKKSWVQRHYIEILDALFDSKHFDVAAFLIEQLPSFGIPYLQHFEDPDLNISIRCYAPVLESILTAMDKLYTEHSHSGSEQLKERLAESHIFDAISQDLLDSQPFESNGDQKLDAVLSSLKLTLDPQIVDAYKSYLKLGNIRNHFLGIYSRFLQLELAASEQPKRFFYELIAYLHSENPAFQHLLCFGGFGYLFLNHGGNGENFLHISLNCFDIYMFSILMRDVSLESLDDRDGNLFHRLLGAVDTSSHEAATETEAHCLRLVRFILFANQIDSGLIIKYLRQKNQSGETPLYLAAHNGMYRVFYTLKKFLNDRAYYSEDEHAPPYFLDTVLLRGLDGRMMRGGNSRELENIRARIKNKIENRNEYNTCLSLYSERKLADTKHQRTIINKINYALAQPIPPKKHPAECLYPNIFQLLINHYFSVSFWTGSFKDFSHAPASIQMSYLRKPVSLIIQKIIYSYAKGSIQADDIMNMLYGKKQNRISNVLKELMFDHINLMMAQDKRKPGQW
ncbi:MAG: hypothetical protein HRU09_09700 [Oligoflexales bacterium]|nr:hypothetical protein [Oligoflexales bacterium]